MKPFFNSPKNNMVSKLLSICLFCSISFTGFAQDTDTSKNVKLFKSEASEMLNLMNQKNKEEERVSITGYKATALRESPGIVTLITEEEIKNSGARDLIDVLRLVPGLNFAHNYENAIGLVVRGNWAEEGKFLLLIDGLILNENGFGTVVFGQRVLASNIKRVEIIRGAGSTIYGGLAELCVINVITRQPESAKSTAEVNITSGVSEGMFSRNAVGVDVFQAYQGGTELSISGFANKGRRGNLKDYDSQGRYISYGDSTEINTQQLNVGLIHKGLQASFIFSNYEYENLNNLTVTFRDYIANILYKWDISKKISIQPRFTYKHMQPWSYRNYQNLPAANQGIYDGYRTINNRYTAGLVGLFSPTENVNFTLGGEFFSEDARYEIPGFLFANDKPKVSFTNVALFGEVLYKSKFANVTAGVRFDKYSAVSAAFVPRIAITKALEKWHFKALYSGSFKAPTIQNIQFSIDNDIKPEKTNMIEVEVGYKINDDISINANVFDIKIQKPIVYYIDRITFSEGYSNLNQTGSRGVEVELRNKQKWGYINLGYSYYIPQYNETENYQVIDENGEVDRNMYLGIPNHKVTLNTNFRIKGSWHISPMLMYFSKKFTYLYNSSADLLLTEFDPEFHLNLVTHFNLMDELKLSIGGYNLLGQKLWFINPYNSGDNPIPEQRQELFLRLSYKLNAK